MSEVAIKVHQIVGAQLGVATQEISDGLYLQDDLNADQLDVAEIVVNLEEAYNVKIPQEELLKFNTVGDVVTYMTERLNEV